MAYTRPIENVKYFVVNNETTDAFTRSFSESFPNANFNNATPVNLATLSNNYEIKPPTLLQGSNEGGNADINSNGTVVSTSPNFFAPCQVGDYLFVEDGGIDALNMLGRIATKNSATSVTLEKAPGNITYGGFGNNLNRTIYHLSKTSPGLPFGENASFYMVIKNPDYDDEDNGGKHNAIPYIDPSISVVSEDVFAYGGTASGNNIVNPTYLAIVYISEISQATNGLTNDGISYTNTIPCTITPVSTLSQQLTEPPFGTILTQSNIPRWSVYLVNPYGTDSTNLPKNTAYRIEVDTDIPVRQIQLPSTVDPNE